MDTRPPAVQVVLLVVPAFIFGIVCGIAIDLAAGAYYALLLLAVLGGIGAGLEHEGGGSGAQRGITGGLLFGTGVIIGHHLLSRRATVALPHPEALELIVAAVGGAIFGAIGGALRGAREAVHRDIELDALERG